MPSIKLDLFVVIYNDYLIFPENVYSKLVCDLRVPAQCDWALLSSGMLHSTDW